MVTLKEIENVEGYNAFINSKDVAIVKFGAPWCTPCRVLEEKLAKLDLEKLGDASIGTINVDEECFDELTSELNIRGIPVLIYYKEGKEVKRTVGGLVTDQQIYDALCSL